MSNETFRADDGVEREPAVSADSLPTCSQAPPCSALLTDMIGVLDDPDRRPRHLCGTVIEESTRRWAHDQVAANPAYLAGDIVAWEGWVKMAKQEAEHDYPRWVREQLERRGRTHEFEMSLVPCATPEDAQLWRQEYDALIVARRQMLSVWEWWQHRWPLPVGREIFKAEECSYNHHRSRGGESILPVMAALPFDADEEALLALHAPLGSGGTLDLFVLGLREEAQPGSYSWSMGPLVYRVRGRDVIVDRAAQLVGRARDWLGRRGGVSVEPTTLRRKGRRPRQISGLTPEESRARCLEVLAFFERGYTCEQIGRQYRDQYGNSTRGSTVNNWVNWGREIRAEASRPAN